jgi:hypothetical protein
VVRAAVAALLRAQEHLDKGLLEVLLHQVVLAAGALALLVTPEILILVEQVELVHHLAFLEQQHIMLVAAVGLQMRLAQQQ